MMYWQQLTQHGYDRLKERRGAKGTSASDIVKKAFEKGKHIEQFNKEMQKYLTNVLKASKGDTLRVFGNDVYLFGNELLITTFAIPQKLIQKTNRPKFRVIDDFDEEE